MIKHIVFDFGGVILDLDGLTTGYPDDLSIIFNLPLENTKEIWNNNKTLVLIGKESPKHFLTRIKSEYKLNFDIDKSLKFWEKRNYISKNRIDWELIEIIEKLKSSYKIYMLTDQIDLDNGSKDWINEINQNFHLILRSYEQGFRKPSPESFSNLLLKINAINEPETVVFIDDNKDNIEAAQKVHIHGILYTFKNHEFLFQEFKKLGIN